MADGSRSVVKHLSLHRNQYSAGFGFSIVGGLGSEFPPVICDILEGSAAAKCSQMRVGDVIVEVNQQAVENKTTKEVVQLLLRSPSILQLTVIEDPVVRAKVEEFLGGPDSVETIQASLSKEDLLSDKIQEKQSKTTHQNTKYHNDDHRNHNGPVRAVEQSEQLENRGRPQYKLSSLIRSSSSDSNLSESPTSRTLTTTAMIHREDSSLKSVTPQRENGSDLQEDSVWQKQDITSPGAQSQDITIPNSLSQDVTTPGALSQDATTPGELSQDATTPGELSQDAMTPGELSQDAMTPGELSQDATTPGALSQDATTPGALSQDATTPGAQSQDAAGSQSSETECSTDQDSQLTDNTVILVNGVEHFSSSSSTEQMSKDAKSPHDETDSGAPVIDISGVQVEFDNDLVEGNCNDKYNGNLLGEENGDSGSSESGSMDSLTESEVSLETELMQTYEENPQKVAGATAPDPGTIGGVGTLELSSARRLAKRLYMLDGFKKSDVARHLSKKNEFSQAVAEEYLKFFDFMGYTLDEALRTFLKAFSLTGETQERERVLMHFSRRFHRNNPDDYASEDSVYTLTCALMLLNTDLHGQNIGKKMTLPEFFRNLDGLNEGDNFPKDLLKNLYIAIKTNPIEWAVDSEDEEENDSLQNRPMNTIRGNGTIPGGTTIGGSPFIEVQVDPNAKVYMKGYIMRKSTKEANAKKTPRGKRSWKMFFATLRGLVLYFHKSEIACMHRFDTMCDMICIHHALATRATDYTKKQFVLRLKLADWSEFLIQCGDTGELQDWMHALNVASATLSSPPLAAPCGSQKRFLRPLLPSTQTRYSKKEQLSQHELRVQSLESELEDHQSNPPERGARSTVVQYWKEKLEYLQYEVSRYKTYVYLLDSTPTPPTHTHQVTVQRSNTSVGAHMESDRGGTSVQRSLSDRYSYRQAIYNSRPV